MKKQVLLTAALVTGGLFLASPAHAQLPVSLSAGPRVGTETKDGNFLIGGQVEMQLPFITLAPNIEHVFVKHVTSNNINLDVQYTAFGAGVAKLFVGGGYVISIAKPDGGKSVTDNGFNLQAGAKAGLAGFNFFGMARYNHIKKADYELVVGTNFKLF